MPKVLLNVRIDPELRKVLQEVAREQNRTLSNLVETTLLRVVADAGREGRPTTKKERISK
jgi:predicted transcriptional regulator